MSTLAAVGADGYYRRPDDDGGGGRRRGDRPAGRPRKNGALVVRFEMPFDVRCLGGCGGSIARGVRFNAEKRHAGDYYTTKIWSFTMRSPCCKHVIAIRTDPKQGGDFVVLEGARRKADPTGLQVIDVGEGGGERDPLEQLERDKEQRAEAASSNHRIVELYNTSVLTAAPLVDYRLNSKLRAENRTRRKQEKRLRAEGHAMGISDDIKLLPKSREDRRVAAATLAARVHGGRSAPESRAKQRMRISQQSIFGASKAPKRKAVRGSGSGGAASRRTPTDKRKRCMN